MGEIQATIGSVSYNRLIFNFLQDRGRDEAILGFSPTLGDVSWRNDQWSFEFFPSSDTGTAEWVFDCPHLDKSSRTYV